MRDLYNVLKYTLVLYSLRQYLNNEIKYYMFETTNQ